MLGLEGGSEGGFVCSSILFFVIFFILLIVFFGLLVFGIIIVLFVVFFDIIIVFLDELIILFEVNIFLLGIFLICMVFINILLDLLIVWDFKEFFCWGFFGDIILGFFVEDFFLECFFLLGLDDEGLFVVFEEGFGFIIFKLNLLLVFIW